MEGKQCLYCLLSRFIWESDVAVYGSVCFEGACWRRTDLGRKRERERERRVYRWMIFFRLSFQCIRIKKPFSLACCSALKLTSFCFKTWVLRVPQRMSQKRLI